MHELGKRLIVVRGDDPLCQEAQANAALNFRMHLRTTLATRHVLEKHHLARVAFDWVVGEIESKFHQSVVHPGEMSGTLAAQSTGEPAAQMMLNTFHYAGERYSKSPVLKQIINGATNIKTPLYTRNIPIEIFGKKSPTGACIYLTSHRQSCR